MMYKRWVERDANAESLNFVLLLGLRTCWHWWEPSQWPRVCGIVTLWWLHSETGINAVCGEVQQVFRGLAVVSGRPSCVPGGKQDICFHSLGLQTCDCWPDLKEMWVQAWTRGAFSHRLFTGVPRERQQPDEHQHFLIAERQRSDKEENRIDH